MPSVKLLPDSVRYLKARFTILKRPTVWISGSLFIAAVVLLAEYWFESQQFATNHRTDRPIATPIATDLLESDAESVLTPLDPYSSVDDLTVEDIAALADAESPIANLRKTETDLLKDNLTWLDAPADLEALLLNPLFASTSVHSRLVSSKTELVIPQWNDPSFSEALRSTGLSADVAKRVEPSQSAVIGSVVTFNRPTASASSFNSLQAAIERHKLADAQENNAVDDAAQLSASPSQRVNSTISTTGDRTAPATAPLSWTQSTNAVQPQPLPGQPASLQTQPYPQFLPQTSPAPGTTGYTLPPALRTPIGFGSINRQSREDRPSAVQPAQSGLNAVPSEASLPFSIPRAVPGRSMGGGAINTFSNP